MIWNTEGIAFLHRPDVFTGTFDNARMQERHEEMLAGKLAAIKKAIASETDPLSALKRLHVNDQLIFLQNNLDAFQDSCRLEETLLLLYCRGNAPFSSEGNSELWNRLFSLCDRARLRGQGEKIPFTSTTVYRGSVSGMKNSLCWTPDRSRAEKFHQRWLDPSLGGGHIYEVDVVADDILLYRKQRHEQILILAPGFIESAVIRDFRP